MSKLAIKGGQPVRTRPFPAYKYIGDEEKKAVNRVLDSGVLSKYLGAWHQDFMGGPEVVAFEQEWAEAFNVKHAIAVNSNTSGLIAALGAIGLNPGDEVIVSPYSMCISATAPLWWGAIPVFADIEADHFCLDPKSVESKISERTKAIVVVDIFGQPHDVAAIKEIAKKRNLFVIEDAAQAPFARYGGELAGTLGDLGIYSLNYHKHIHTGEGGLVVTNDDNLADKVRLIRNHGEAVVGPKGITDIVNIVGQNYRLTEIQAAIGREQLKKLSHLVEVRVRNAQYLASKIGRLPGIVFPLPRPKTTHVYYLQPALFDESKVGVARDVFIDAVRAELPVTTLRETEGPRVTAGYVQPLYMMPLFQKRIAFGKDGYPFSLIKDNSVSYSQGSCPTVERLEKKELFKNDVMRPPMTSDDLDDVVRAFEKVYENREELRR